MSSLLATASSISCGRSASVGPSQVAPSQCGLKDPEEWRRSATNRGIRSTSVISDGRDATNFVCVPSDSCSSNALINHINYGQSPQPLADEAYSKKRVASPSPELCRQEVMTSVRSPSPSGCPDVPLHTPPPTDLGSNATMRVARSLRQRQHPRCINNNFACPQVGWKIHDFCEACHG